MKSEDTLNAILFDIDDTLFDRREAIKRVLQGIIGKLPVLFNGISENKIIEAFRMADRMALEEFNKGSPGKVVRDKRSKEFLKSLGLDDKFSNKITAMYVDAYPSVSISVKNAKFVVKRLAERFPLGIVSNGFPDIQYNKLRALGIEKKFQVILLSEEIGIRKPDVRIFKRAADLLRRKTKDCLFVGDSLDTDIAGAKKSGMQACWFNRDGKPVVHREIKPDFEITVLSELLDILGD